MADCIPVGMYEVGFNETELNTSETLNTTYNIIIFNETMPPEYWYYKNISMILEMYVIPVLCVLGVLGNILNIAVLSHRRLYHSVEHLERSALTGLLCLAASDMLLCTSILPHAFRKRDIFAPSVDFWLIYNTYSAAIINTWMLCSAWLTVALAVCRYLAVCKPLYARSRSQSMGRIVGGVLFGSIVVNLPRYWKEVITSVHCVGGGHSYYAIKGPLQHHYPLHLGYILLYFLVGIVIPIIVLIYCTSQLIKALHQSRMLRRQHSSADSTSNSNRNLVTSTLCAVVIFYILLVSPAELLNFIRHFTKRHFSMSFYMKYGLAVSACNTLQAVNFSFHFLLYCIVNAHFRRVALGLLSCVLPAKWIKFGLIARTRNNIVTWKDKRQLISQT